jgi:hypothetical protein
MLLTLPAVAHDFGQWKDQPSSARQWFQKLMQPDNPYQSCCGEADASEADTFEVSHNQYVAIITNGKGIIPDGTRVPVPNQKLKWDNGNLTGHGIIFIGANGQVYCYVTPCGHCIDFLCSLDEIRFAEICHALRCFISLLACRGVASSSTEAVMRPVSDLSDEPEAT